MTPDELRAIRKAAGLTQAEMAEILDVSRKTLVNWEKAYFQIPADISKQIATKGLSKTNTAAPKPLKIAEPYYTLRPGVPRSLKSWMRTLAHPLWYQGSLCPAYHAIKQKDPQFDIDRVATTTDLAGYTEPTPDQAYHQLVAFGCAPKAAYDYLCILYRSSLTVPDPAPVDPRIRHENEWLIAHGSLDGFFDAYPQYAEVAPGPPDPELVAAFENAFNLKPTERDDQ